MSTLRIDASEPAGRELELDAEGHLPKAQAPFKPGDSVYNGHTHYTVLACQEVPDGYLGKEWIVVYSFENGKPESYDCASEVTLSEYAS